MAGRQFQEEERDRVRKRRRRGQSEHTVVTLPSLTDTSANDDLGEMPSFSSEPPGIDVSEDADEDVSADVAGEGKTASLRTAFRDICDGNASNG